jgi:iron complex outermembrane receptor protein
MKRMSPALAVTAAIAALSTTGVTHADPTPPRNGDLHEIVVSATPFDRSPLEIAQPTIVLSGDDLRRDLGASLGETVARQLGVTGSYFGPNASRPVIRGLGGERVQMLQDGIEALDVSALSSDHAVSVEGIAADQIEILKGPATLLYGNGAVGGLVNVQTNRIHATLPARVSGALELRGDTALGERTGAARLDLPVGPAAIHVDAFRRRTDDVRIPDYGPSRAEREELAAEGEDFGPRGRIENSAGEAQGASIGASWIGSRGYVGVGYTRYETNYGLPGGEHSHAATADADGTGARAALARDAFATSARILGGETALGAAGDGPGPRIDMTQNRYDLAGALDGGEGWFRKLRYRGTYSDYAHAELEGDGAVGTQFEQSGFDQRVAIDHAFGAWRGTAGVQYRDVDFVARGDEAFVPASRTKNAGVFVFEERPVDVARGALTLELGARAERQTIVPDRTRGLDEYAGTSATGSAGAVWTFRPDVALAVNLTHAERHPTSTELYADGPHAAVQRFEVGDPRLDLERSNALDLSLRSAGDAAVRWQVNAYVNDFSNFIYLQPTGGVADGYDVYDYRQGGARFTGLEGEVTVPLATVRGGRLEARFAGDMVRATLDGGGPVPQIPPWRVGTELSWRADRASAGLSVYRYGRQGRVAAFERPTDGYTMVDLDVDRRVDSPLGEVLLFAKAGNLLDVDARRHTSPLKEFAPLPGRSLTAGVRLQF